MTQAAKMIDCEWDFGARLAPVRTQGSGIYGRVVTHSPIRGPRGGTMRESLDIDWQEDQEDAPDVCAVDLIDHNYTPWLDRPQHPLTHRYDVYAVADSMPSVPVVLPAILEVPF